MMQQPEMEPEELHGGVGGPPEREDGGNGERTPDEGNEETQAQREAREALEQQARLDLQEQFRAQRAIERLEQKAKNEDLSEDELEEYRRAKEIINRLIGRAAVARQAGAGPSRDLTAYTERMTAAEMTRRREELYQRFPGQEAIIDSLIHQRRIEEQTSTYYQEAIQGMKLHWTQQEKLEWLQHQMRILIESRKGPQTAETQIAFNLLQRAINSFGTAGEELKKIYDPFLPFYDHFTRMITTKELQDIIDSAGSKFKATDLDKVVRLPHMGDAIRLWEKHGSYKEYLLNNAPKDVNDKPLESILLMQDYDFELRRLSMVGEMVKFKLTDLLKNRYKQENAGISDEQALTQAQNAVAGLNLEFLNKDTDEWPEKEHFANNESAYEAAILNWRQRAEQRFEEQRRRMLGKIQRFIEQQHLDIAKSFFTTDGQVVEQVELDGKREVTEDRSLGPNEFRRRSGSETVFEDAQLSVYFGEAVWRTFERAALLDGANPHAPTPEGGGENPLRRLLTLRKYGQELLKDGKIKHAQPQIVEHLRNPVRDFISDAPESFWEKQPPIVKKWYLEMVNTPNKIDADGRFLDLSKCPFEYIDFTAGYQEIKDRSPFTPHYSNYAELAEELRKQEVLKPGALLETPTLENYINFAKLYRNLRSEDVPENKKTRDETARRAREGKGRPPVVSREEASYELFRGLMKYWRENRMMDKETIANAILFISDPFQETLITPEHRKKLLIELYGQFWGRWPMWELRQTWGKLDWGAGLLDAIKAFFKEVFKQK